MYEHTLGATTTSYLPTATAAEVADVSAISRQMTLVQKLLAEHREIQSIVGQRLNAVLRPSSPVSAEGNGQQNPRSAPSPLVADLEGFVMSLQQLLSGYQDILNRLEL